MRYAPVFLFLMAACGAPGGPSTVAEVDDEVPDAALTDPVGYYSDTLPCSDCAGILIDLWVRSDSTFVLQQHFLRRDKLPFGMVGKWTMADGQLELHDPKRVVRRLLPTSNGLNGLDQGVLPIPVGQVVPSLPRLGDELAHGMAPMRLAGAFTYFAEAMSFRPCGSERNWPSAGGREWTDEGEELGSMGTAELQERYLNAVAKGGDPWAIEVECSMAMGPAMEGDGADEYIFIHRVLRALGPGQCP